MEWNRSFLPYWTSSLLFAKIASHREQMALSQKPGR
jgi:hypothetical protein